MDTDENGTPERRAAGASDNPGSTPRRAMPAEGGQPPAAPSDSTLR